MDRTPEAKKGDQGLETFGVDNVWERIGKSKVGRGVTAALGLGALGGAACAPSPTAEQPPAIVTPDAKPTLLPASPTLPPEPTATRVVEPTKLPAMVTPEAKPSPSPTVGYEIGIGLEVGVGGGALADILGGYYQVIAEVSRSDFESANPGLKLIAPIDVYGKEYPQRPQNFQNDNRETQVAFNPTYPNLAKPDKLRFDATSQLVIYTNEKGERFYHVPFAPPVQGAFLVVFLKDGVYSQAFMDKNYKLVSRIEPYWQKYPDGAESVKLVRGKESADVVASDKAGNALKTFFVMNLPVLAEPTAVPTKPPTPEPAPTKKVYQHLYDEKGREIGLFSKEYREGGRLYEILNSVISREPYQGKILVYDKQGKPIYQYNGWFMDVEYPDLYPPNQIIKKSIFVWNDDARPGASISLAKDRIVSDSLSWYTESNREAFFALLKKDKPVQAWLLREWSPEDWQLILNYTQKEPWPGNDWRARLSWFNRVLYGGDSERKMDPVNRLWQIIISPN